MAILACLLQQQLAMSNMMHELVTALTIIIWQVISLCPIQP